LSAGQGAIEPAIAGVRPPPSGAIHVAQLVTDPAHTPAQIVELVASDPEISRRVLRLVAADPLGMRPAAGSGTVLAAAHALGTRAFGNLVVASWCSEYFRDVDAGYALPAGGMWRQAVAAGLVAEKLAARARIACAGAAFTAGILADIGKTVLAPLLAERLPGAGPAIDASEDEFVMVERQHLGTDHAETGAAVAQKWDLHPLYQSAIRNHHDRERMADDGAMTSIVHLAVVIVSELGLGGGLDSLRCHAACTIPALLRLTESDLDRVKLDLLDELSEPASLTRLPARLPA
jgi:HD-like signal output (HDOD) protein